ncbi:MAG: Hsp20/alpha crystallin family protein [Deltaproteobacteria bacterium]|nr:Hsp20/alpha crystallin family protein [Deltaproteobacteria bacterium]
MASLLSLIPRTNRFLPSRDLFDGFFEDWNVPSLFGEDKNWIPAFDITENEKEYVVTAELPGVEAKELDVTFTDGLLTVKGEKKQEKEEKGENYHRVERQFGTFQRSFRIPDEVKNDQIDAHFKDGVLKLTIPKAEEGKPKKIEVK